MGKLLGHNAPLIGISYEYETEYLYNHIYDVGTIKFDDIKIYNVKLLKYIYFLSLIILLIQLLLNLIIQKEVKKV